GPPLPYRLGETYPTDLRVRAYFETINQPQTDQVREDTGTAAGPVVERYPVGVPLGRRGQPITPAQVMILQEEHRAYLRSLKTADHTRRGVALFLVISLLAGVVVLYSVRFQHALAQSLAKVASVCALVVLTLACCLLLSGPPWHACLI